jgi:hypothetical protein
MLGTPLEELKPSDSALTRLAVIQRPVRCEHGGLDRRFRYHDRYGSEVLIGMDACGQVASPDRAVADMIKRRAG